MKKSLTLFFTFCLGIIGANAQITINSSDIAVPGKIFFQAVDTLPSMTIDTGTVNKVWNYASTLNPTVIDTLTYVHLVDAPNQADFPTANVVMPFGSLGGLNYMVNSPTQLISLGNTENVILYIGAYPTTILKTANPTEKIFNFPTAYNSYFSDSTTTFAQYFFGSVPRTCGLMDSLRETTTVNKKVLADAWGSLTTSFGTFDALRIKETRWTRYVKDGHDASLSAWFNLVNTKDSVTTYSWWTNNIGYPILTAVMDSTGNVKTAKWLMAPSATLGINELTSSSQVNVFPDPAQDQVNFVTTASKGISVQVFDIAGRMISSYPLSNDRAIINTSDFANGIYTYSIIGKNSTILNRGKFTIAK